MKKSTYSVAAFAVISLVLSLVFGVTAERAKADSERYRGLWLNYHQKFLDNQENEEIKEKTIYYNNLSFKYTEKSLHLDAIARGWQASFQAFFLCLMFILVEFTLLGKREWKEWTKWARGATLATLLSAILIFGYALLLLIIL